ncbi:sigma-70 family RNA polymerase sigma factor [Roseibacillus persicicus]|uniref:sigma-70 family RNA polymerase sigma factor n=1 Tax=Roseibacillus persicicus TaxID=454148 RepID=UPI00398B7901
MFVAEEDSSLSRFEQDIRSVQSRLKSYLFASVGNRSDADDILQETNLVLWRKRSDFQDGTSFWAWSQRVAFFQLMAFRKRRSQNRLILDDDVVHLMAAEAPDTLSHEKEPQEKRLRSCLAALPERQRHLVEGHYFERKSLKTLAKNFATTVPAVGQALYRARHNLQLCLQKKNSTPSS